MTGLTAGYLLAKSGERCLLIERQDEVGGLCRSYTLDGILFDLGPHLFFQEPGSKPEELVMDAISDLDLIERRFRFAIHHEGRFYRFPLSLWGFLLYPWVYKKEMILGLLKKGTQRDCDKRSAENELTQKSGMTYYRNLFDGMLYKKTMMKGSQLHRDWTVRVDRSADNKKEPFYEKMAGMRFVKQIVNLLIKPTRYIYPAEGFRKLPDRLFEEYTKLGGETLFGTGKIKFEMTAGTIDSIKVDSERRQVKNVIWTGSVNQLNNVLGVTDTPKLHYINVVIVMLTYNRRRQVKRPFIYVYYPDEKTVFNRLYYPQSIYRERSPAQVEGVCIEINTPKNKEEIDKEELVDKCAADLERLELFKKSDLRQSEVKILEQSLPVYDLDYEPRMEAAYAGVRKYDNLYSVGRIGGYYFCLTPSAVSQGIKAADAVLSKL